MWRKHYKIGEAQIDEQHKQLLLTMEDLLKVLKNDADSQKDEFKRIFKFLKDYTKIHFQAEEMLQQKVGYAGYDRHKAIHSKFTADLRELELELMRLDYDPQTMQRLANMMTQWWMYHIMKEDKKILAGKPAETRQQ